jgi:hypothetical protein
MANVFTSIGHFFGKVGLGLVALVTKVDAGVDADVPKIEAVIEQGASVATLIPGIGPKVAQILNAGVQLLGDFKATVDGLDAVTEQAVAQLKALAPTGYSIVLIKQDVEADIKLMLSEFETEYEAAKGTVSTLSAPASTTVPVTLNQSVVADIVNATLEASGKVAVLKTDDVEEAPVTASEVVTNAAAAGGVEMATHAPVEAQITAAAAAVQPDPAGS